MQKVYYSQCYEDPLLLDKALSINKTDDVLSITSAGDNSLYLLSLHPNSITVIDINSYQNNLFQNKLSIIKNCNDKKEAVKSVLKISSSGRFEKYLDIFRSFTIPYTISKKSLYRLINAKNLEDQRQIYYKYINNFLWITLFKILASKLALKYKGRHPDMFKYHTGNNVGDIYLKRLERICTTLPLNNNYFFDYCFTKSYDHTELPEYLKDGSLVNICKSNALIRVVNQDIYGFLKSTNENTYSKYNLSDIFESMSLESNNNVWHELIRTSKNNAIIIYWQNLVDRFPPAELSKNLKFEQNLSEHLNALDRSFFYKEVRVYKIIK